MRAAAMTFPKISPQSWEASFEVRTVEACSWRRVMSWKKSMAPVLEAGRYPIVHHQDRMGGSGP